MFGTKANENYDGLQIATLEPGKYENMILDKVEFKNAEKKSGEQGKQILNFTFANESGDVHTHTEWELKEEDGEKKISNFNIRIGHILSKFMPKEDAVVSGNTFEEIAQAVVAKLNNVPNRESIKVDILVTGNVYQGKAKSGFTGFPPFIAKHGEQLVFSSNALGDNKKYYAFKEKQNPTQPDGEATAPGNEGITTEQGGVNSDF